MEAIPDGDKAFLKNSDQKCEKAMRKIPSGSINKSEEPTDASLCSKQKKQHSQSKNGLNDSTLDKVSLIDTTDSIKNFFSNGSTMDSNCVQSEEKRYIGDIIYEMSTRADEQSIPIARNQTRDNLDNTTQDSANNQSSQESNPFGFPEYPMTTGIKLSIDNAFKFVTQKHSNEIPFMIKIQDLDGKNTDEENPGKKLVLKK